MATEDIITTANRWLEEGRNIALATVVETWGSAPCPRGSQLVVDTGSHFEGSVSGGCVETAVISEALDVIKTRQPRMLEFGVTNDMAWEVGLACGGQIKVYVESIEPDQLPRRALLEQINGYLGENKPCVLIRNLDTHDSYVMNPGLHVTAQDAELHDCAVNALTNDRCFHRQFQGQDYFIQPFNPPLRLIIIGAVHIGQYLAASALSCGYEVIMVDPRQAFASEERFPGVTINRDWPDVALTNLGIDSRTAITTLTHDPKLDDPALNIALRSQAFYIGALGSRKTQAARVKRLERAGFKQAEIARLDAPIGLDIGAQSPAEIAISVMAQITDSLRNFSPDKGG